MLKRSELGDGGESVRCLPQPIDASDVILRFLYFLLTSS